jgi:transposase
MLHSITKTAGIDTGKKRLALGFWPRGERFAADNSPEGFAILAGHLKAACVRRVGIESTSVYHLAVTDYLRAEGFEVVVLQPSKVKAFARLQGIKAKSDAPDAELVAGAAQAQERVYAPQAPEMAALAEHLTYIEQCEDNCARLKTQAERFTSPDLIAKKNSEIAAVRRAIASELKALEKAARRYPDLALNLDLAVTVPGVGMRTALTMVIRVPELGTLGREKAACLVGVAPFDDDTADRKGERHIQGGRTRARKALFLSAFSGAIHHNPWLGHIYKRLLALGKSHKCAIIACARKLIGLLDAIFARKTPWETRGGLQCPS